MTDVAVPLAEVLLIRAERMPEAAAYEIVEPGGHVTTLTNAQLAGRASTLAGQLTACGDGPVLLVYPAGLDYVVAIFAGFLAGRPLVPGYPPGPRSRPGWARLDGIVKDARPSAVIAPDRRPDVPVPTVLRVPGPEADGAGWRRPTGAVRQQVAIIQYTSGSTGRPRGVLVRHDSVAANTAAIAERFGLDPTSRGLTWLPPYHDMGLVGGILTPMAAGIPVRIMPPETFLKAPLSWLRQISDSGATVSGGPNFGYDLCVRRARHDGALEGLDLSNWRVAFNGGETVRPRTMAEFADRFATVGFDPGAFMPCYGLAEATLIVSAGRWSGPSAVGAVSCGTPVDGQRVAIVDPERAAPCDDGREGEIWVAGGHVTPGYWSGDPAGLFGTLEGVSFLRTGDRGFRRDGELFVTGRTKDVMVFRGVNHHAVDVEAAALDAVGDLGGVAAAFLVDDGPRPLPALVLEVRGPLDDRLAATVRTAVLARTGLALGLVALVPPRSVPRTSSGKVQRSRCREALLEGAYDNVLVGDRATLAAQAGLRARRVTTSELATVICGILAGVCEAEDCLPTDNLTEKGVDSVRAAEAAAVLEDALGLSVPLEAVLFSPTPLGMADALVQRWLAEDREVSAVRDRVVTVAGGGQTGGRADRRPTSHRAG